MQLNDVLLAMLLLYYSANVESLLLSLAALHEIAYEDSDECRLEILKYTETRLNNHKGRGKGMTKKRKIESVFLIVDWVGNILLHNLTCVSHILFMKASDKPLKPKWFVALMT
jgi:hypothetical protein